MHRWDGARRSCNAAHPLAMRLALGLDATTISEASADALSGRERLNARVDAIPTRIAAFGSFNMARPTCLTILADATVADHRCGVRSADTAEAGRNVAFVDVSTCRGAGDAVAEAGRLTRVASRAFEAALTSEEVLLWNGERSGASLRDEARRHPNPADNARASISLLRVPLVAQRRRVAPVAPRTRSRELVGPRAVGALLHDPMASSCRFDSSKAARSLVRALMKLSPASDSLPSAVASLPTSFVTPASIATTNERRANR